MEHNENMSASAREQKVEMARCPHCNALCLNGHDVDNQIYCAKCGLSFIPKSYVELTAEEYEEMKKKATTRHEKSAWIAYTVGKIN